MSTQKKATQVPNRRVGVFVALSERMQQVRDGEAGFAMVFSLLLIMIVAALSIGVAGLIYSQTKPTQFQRKDVRTINAATAGTQVVLDKLRAASDGSGNGKLTLLPCTSATGASFTFGTSSATVPGTTLTGSVGSGPGALQYDASVSYLTVNPTQYEPGGTGAPANSTYAQFNSWLQTNALPCPLSTVPSYAFIQSRGAGSSAPGVSATQGNRSVHSVYQFATSALNVPGGRIIESLTNPAMCIEAPDPATVGSQLTVAPCQALGDAQQTFQYRNDLTIAYTGDPAGGNLCITNPSTGNLPTLQTCVTDGSTSVVTYSSGYPVAGQQAQEWGFNDSGHFAAALSDGTVTNGSGGQCLEPSGATYQTPPSTTVDLVVTSCDGQTVGYTAWTPDPQVGAGKAGGNITGLPGTPTYQYVNYYEFGRCLDVNGQNVTNSPPLIDYPCKQAPDSTRLTWNQLWTYSAVSGGYGVFYTVNGSGSFGTSGAHYCLTAPASGSQIQLSVCNSTLDSQLWKPTGDISDNYTNSFLLFSKSRSLCMGLSGASPQGWSTPSVETCTGALDQKWNAKANPPGTGLADVQEDAGSEH